MTLAVGTCPKCKLGRLRREHDQNGDFWICVSCGLTPSDEMVAHFQQGEEPSSSPDAEEAAPTPTPLLPIYEKPSVEETPPDTFSPGPDRSEGRDKRTISQDTIDKIREMKRAGKSTGEIKRELSVSYSTVYKYSVDIPSTAAYKEKLEPDVVEQIQDAVASGQSQKSVAEDLGVAESTVSKYAEGNTPDAFLQRLRNMHTEIEAEQQKLELDAAALWRVILMLDGVESGNPAR